MPPIDDPARAQARNAMLSRRSLLGALGVAGALPFGVPAWARQSAPLDVAWINGRIWTGAGPAVRTDAIGATGDRIVAIGSGAVKARSGPSTLVIDLAGAFVTPGLIDGHTHFVLGSQMLTQPSLRDAPSPQEFTRLVAEAARALPKGEWLRGGSWDQDRWGGEMPHRRWIDAVTPDTPVAVTRYDLHMVLLNSAAMARIGVDRNTADVAGGVILRDADGAPTGIFKDAAKDMVLARIGEPTPAEIDAAVRRGIAHGLSKGVTQVHCTEIDWGTYEATRRLRSGGETGMRFRNYLPLKDWQRQADIVAREGSGDDWVRWGACKVVFDGSLGSRTARFYEPYLDDPSTRGIIVTDPADLRQWMAGADKAGLQVSAHAIGDEANDMVLDTMAAVAKANGKRDRRFRIEHAQHVRPQTIGRFARQGVIASMQPYHAIDDGRWAVRRIGPERLKTSFAVGSLVRAGGHVVLGSDWPVAPLDPLTGISAAVLRETLDGLHPEGWYPEQRITLAQALKCYTREGAYTGFAEARQGLIAPGYLADFAVFDRDLFAIPPEDILNAKVVRTIVGGVQRFGEGV